MKKLLVRVLGGIALFGFQILSCTEKSTDPEPPLIEFAENAEQLDDGTLALLTSTEDSTLIFSSSNPQLSSLSTNDIIVCGISNMTPNGLLGKISHLSAQRDTIELTHTTLEDAFDILKIQFEKELTPADLNSSLSSLRPMAPNDTLDLNFNYLIDNVILYDADGDENTTNDQAVANGHLAFDIRIIGDIDIGFNGLNYFIFKTVVEENAQINVEANIDLVDVHAIEPIIPPLYFYTFMIGPIAFTPKIDLRCGLDGSVTVSAAVDVTQQASVEAGIEYTNGEWGIISSLDNSFSYEIPTLSSEAYVRVWTGLQLTLLIYGFVGPYAENIAFARLETDLYPQYEWRLYGGFEANVGAEVDILGWTVVDYHASVINQEQLLLDGPDNLPPDPPSNPSPPDSSDNQPVNTILEWNCLDPNGDEITYEVYFGITDPPPYVQDQTNINYDPPGELENETTYYWQIIAKDGEYETEGYIWNFTTTEHSGLTASLIANPDTGVAPLEVLLDASGSTGEITIYIFVFGDNSPSYTEIPGDAPDGIFDGKTTHTYDIGSFQAGVAVSDNQGRNDWAEDSIFVDIDPNYGFIDPRDGQIYSVVQIGNQIWMGENLRYNTPNSVFYNNDPSYLEEYGRLYPVEDLEIACPAGWHLPSYSEWWELRNAVGGYPTAGGELKEEGYNHWLYPNTGATNTSGFTGLPGGRYMAWPGVGFEEINRQAWFWVDNSGNGPRQTTLVTLLHSSARFYIYMLNYDPDDPLPHDKLAIRCVKDQ